MTSAQHSKGTKRWGTSPDVVEACRRTMGGIDLDPCSEERFQAVVLATEYYSLLERGQDALALPWFGRVMCNPPGGVITEFWNHAFSQPIEQMMWVGFSVEQLCVLADEDVHPSDFSICFLRRRIRFRRHDGYSGSPSHGNYVVGVGVDCDAFDREFSELGKIQHGPMALRSSGGTAGTEENSVHPEAAA